MILIESINGIIIPFEREGNVARKNCSPASMTSVHDRVMYDLPDKRSDRSLNIRIRGTGYSLHACSPGESSEGCFRQTTLGPKNTALASLGK